ncbi:hypothetical protein DTL42_17820 [Bremerella cremea]|uniref:Uncharacterized protein n=1 Tax=Bremerella cremea TaxID=1031537 RepID=A0A368KNP3_9BACT|nr:hypothetical protein [Bremerella cremea]RCS44771.1 hypothetical protein DTL42_17820 [Bremerella cremea]
MLQNSSDRHRNPLLMQRLLAFAAAIAGGAALFFLYHTENSQADRTVIEAQRYQLMDLSLSDGLHSVQGHPVLYYRRTLGTFQQSPQNDWSYTRSTSISFDAFRENTSEFRDRVVNQINSSTERANFWLRNPQPVLRYAALDAITFYREDGRSREIADHVYDAIGELSRDPDPFIAGYAIDFFHWSHKWSHAVFQQGCEHKVTAIRAESIDYLGSVFRDLSDQERTAAMKAMLPLLDDPHSGIRQLSELALVEVYASVAAPATEDMLAMQLREQYYASNSAKLPAEQRERLKSWQERVNALPPNELGPK